MKNKILVTVLAILGLIFGILGLILSFFPLGTIDIIPAIIGLLFGSIAYFISRKSTVRRKLVFTVLIVSTLAILISVLSAIFIKQEVAEDNVFEEKIEQSVEESTEDLEEALEDLEDIEEMEDIE